MTTTDFPNCAAGHDPANHWCTPEHCKVGPPPLSAEEEAIRRLVLGFMDGKRSEWRRDTEHLSNSLLAAEEQPEEIPAGIHPDDEKRIRTNRARRLESIRDALQSKTRLIAAIDSYSTRLPR